MHKENPMLTDHNHPLPESMRPCRTWQANRDAANKQELAMTNRKKTILIVDDRKSNIRLFKAMLMQEGYCTFSAGNGNEALTLARQQLPDLILLDVLMPDMDGYQVAGKLKLDPATRNIPVIMVT